MAANYVITDWLPFVKTAFFVDSLEHESAIVFAVRGLRTSYDSEFVHEGVPYVITTVKLWPWQRKRFEECMLHLHGLLDSDEYEAACQKLQDVVART